MKCPHAPLNCRHAPGTCPVDNTAFMDMLKVWAEHRAAKGISWDSSGGDGQNELTQLEWLAGIAQLFTTEKGVDVHARVLKYMGDDRMSARTCEALRAGLANPKKRRLYADKKTEIELYKSGNIL